MGGIPLTRGGLGLLLGGLSPREKASPPRRPMQPLIPREGGIGDGDLSVMVGVGRRVFF